MAIKKLSAREKGRLSGEELADYEYAVSVEKRAAPPKFPQTTPLSFDPTVKAQSSNRNIFLDLVSSTTGSMSHGIPKEC